MGEVISISVYRDRKAGVAAPLTEEQAAMLRGYVAWKRSNHQKMKEADEALRTRGSGKLPDHLLKPIRD